MNRQQRFFMVSIAASSLAVWLYIVTQVQPNLKDTLVLVTFFVAQTVWIGSLIAFSLFRWRIRQGNREVIYAHTMPSIRQGFTVAGVASLLLFLQLLRVISVWEVVLVILMAVLFEAAVRQPRAVVRRKS